jgi:hypothetical protein
MMTRMDDESWWVGTVAMAGTWERGEESLEEVEESELGGEVPPPSDLGRVPELPLGNHFDGESDDDEQWNPRTPWPAPKKASGGSQGRQQPHSGTIKRRRLRKKEEETKDQEWEWARQDAWLREMLSDTSSDDDEDSSGRFAESWKWMPELFEPS